MKITRETELHGARLGATSDREAISYTAQFMRNDLGYIGHTVAETIASALAALDLWRPPPHPPSHLHL